MNYIPNLITLGCLWIAAVYAALLSFMLFEVNLLCKTLGIS